MNDLVRPDTGLTLFSAAELACRHCGQMVLAAGFADRLIALRMTWGRPMTITSGCRCTQHNRAVGGAADSMHISDDPARPGSCAVDIAMPDLALAGALAFMAWGMGWSIGVPSPSKGFLHLDRRRDLGRPQLLFGY